MENYQTENCQMEYYQAEYSDGINEHAWKNSDAMLRKFMAYAWKIHSMEDYGAEYIMTIARKIMRHYEEYISQAEQDSAIGTTKDVCRKLLTSISCDMHVCIFCAFPN